MPEICLITLFLRRLQIKGTSQEQLSLDKNAVRKYLSDRNARFRGDEKGLGTPSSSGHDSGALGSPGIRKNRAQED